jgi:hypothetical protein
MRGQVHGILGGSGRVPAHPFTIAEVGAWESPRSATLISPDQLERALRSDPAADLTQNHGCLDF